MAKYKAMLNNNPLIIKEFKVKVHVDGNLIDIVLYQFDNFEIVRDKAYSIVNRDLKNGAMDSQGIQISNLDDFILKQRTEICTLKVSTLLGHIILMGMHQFHLQQNHTRRK